MSELFADLGNPEVALPVLAAACAYAAAVVRGRRWLAPLCVLGALGGAAVAVSLVKVWLGRPGPLGGVNYYPSGHTATAAVAYGGAALLLCLSVRRLPSWPAPVAAVVLTVLCGAGLVWRGYHWPLDVLASLCLSWVLLAPAAAAVRRGPARRVRAPRHSRHGDPSSADEGDVPDTGGPGPATARPDS
ncbi:undecaprenyl-diphosphatase [Streptomyces sp. WMMB 714]|uniref:phosphatase PAP2 family protein n=1 Tax=Streptomyces sp. WMMB 714 TaxID=1286822 RepID=UPI000823A065|nr:phosphatase PAP2 family protein [Streptomyces sp. WMMB 714]SCK37056.1 undecaprenyl-diphosphatase [Streptomyces sp. WMMB 714]